MSVTVPVVVPFTNTEAPMTGSPSSAEVTVPVTLDTWAEAQPTPKKRKANMYSTFFCILFV